MMAYTVKEIYASIQGEGAQTGRAAVLCRFAGCNLWSGREQDRDAAAGNFCDTNFEGSNGPGGGANHVAAGHGEGVQQYHLFQTYGIANVDGGIQTPSDAQHRFH